MVFKSPDGAEFHNAQPDFLQLHSKGLWFDKDRSKLFCTVAICEPEPQKSTICEVLPSVLKWKTL